MNFDAGTRTKIYADLVLDFDPTGSTVDVSVDGTWYPAAWVGSPVHTGSTWTQTAQTTGYFAGPAATATGATVLPLGRHFTETRVSNAGQVIVRNSTPIDVG